MNPYLLLSILTLLFTTCVQPPDYSDVPELTYESINRKEIRQGSFGTLDDSLILRFSYTDGDGNIGAIATDTFVNNIFLIDSRTGLETKNAVPFIPSEGVGNGISGTISVLLTTANSGVCCIFDDKNRQDPCTASTEFPTDTFTYMIYLIDQDGNESNRIETEPIIILCQ